MAAAPAVASAMLRVSACRSDGSRRRIRVPVVSSVRKLPAEIGGNDLLMYGIAANICYTGGWITELVVARFWRVDTVPFGPIAFALGTALSVLVTLIPAGLVIAAAAMTSCGAQGLCSTELKAIRAASDLLSRHRSASDYEAAKAHVQNSAAKWYVWVPRVTAPGVVMPAEALIEVNKVNCASRWVPQR